MHYEKSVPSEGIDIIWFRSFEFDKINNRWAVGEWEEGKLEDFETKDGIYFYKKLKNLS